jgi:hypothetical protein
VHGVANMRTRAVILENIVMSHLKSDIGYDRKECSEVRMLRFEVTAAERSNISCGSAAQPQQYEIKRGLERLATCQWFLVCPPCQPT